MYLVSVYTHYGLLKLQYFKIHTRTHILMLMEAESGHTVHVCSYSCSHSLSYSCSHMFIIHNIYVYLCAIMHMADLDYAT